MMPPSSPITPPDSIHIDLRRFPPISSLRLLDSIIENDRINFSIKKRLKPYTAWRFVYIAELDDSSAQKIGSTASKEIFVKFTSSYCPTLHSFCETEGFAPKLYACEELPGGWFCVAMECIPSAGLTKTLVHDHGAEWIKRMGEIVRTIHKINYVHGDLRLANFICDGGRLLLIDFDWGGRDGEVKFPDVELQLGLRSDRGEELITKYRDLAVIRDTIKEVQGHMGVIPRGDDNMQTD